MKTLEYKNKQSEKRSRSKVSGQVMIMTTLAIGGTILGAATIAGLLVVYQIRATTDLADSAKVIFAADAGIEWKLYNYFKGTTSTPNPLPQPDFLSSSDIRLTVACLDDSFTEIDCGTLGNSSATAIKSVGTYKNSSRAFFVFIQGVTSTFPTP
ncbi:MAG: hypothetical protein HYT13_00835 [Candidatus Liptonbacteria bacterium]|nr:hypothetical protein [Candidatus Liptonbacteria bacterium]